MIETGYCDQLEWRSEIPDTVQPRRHQTTERGISLDFNWEYERISVFLLTVSQGGERSDQVLSPDTE